MEGYFVLLAVDVNRVPRDVPEVLGKLPAQTAGAILDKRLDVDYVLGFAEPRLTWVDAERRDVLLDDSRRLESVQG